MGVTSRPRAAADGTQARGGVGERADPGDIFALAEMKAEVTLLAGLNTKHGTVIEGYPVSGAVGYIAQFRKGDVDAMVIELESRIDALQDKLDTFNATTIIAVDRNTVAAAEEK